MKTTPVPAGRGVWLAASIRLGRPVPITEPYPHVCQVGAQRRDCPPCVTQAEAAKLDTY